MPEPLLQVPEWVKAEWIMYSKRLVATNSSLRHPLNPLPYLTLHEYYDIVSNNSKKHVEKDIIKSLINNL